MALELRDYIRDIPDFPKPGIGFKDITPLLSSAEAFRETLDRLAAPYLRKGVTKVVAIESRGFIFGAPLARALQCGFVPIRKPGKLPYQTVRHEYELEYGSDVLEMHEDALVAGDHVLLVDDVLATGGTAAAATSLIRSFGSEVTAVAFVIELSFLHGRDRLSDVSIHSLIEYD
ncbi:MAG: adenine phosphoribosyltransferase [Thermoanaerobaculia bacterium]